MPGLGNSGWASGPSPKSFGKGAKTPNEAKNITVPSFNFTMPKLVPTKDAASPRPFVSSESALAEVKESAKTDKSSPGDEMRKPQSKVAAAIQATKGQMAKIMGQRRQDRPSTANGMVGKGLSASYGGYSKRK